MIINIMKPHPQTLFIKTLVTLALAVASIVISAAPSRGQAETPTYLPLVLKPLPPPTIDEPEWVYTNDCAKAPPWEGSAPANGATIGQVARKIAFITYVRNAVGKTYTAEWFIDGATVPGLTPTTRVIEADDVVVSSTLVYGTNGCEDPQPPGLYEVRISIDGAVFFIATIRIN
jgi:hypothetical protein